MPPVAPTPVDALGGSTLPPRQCGRCRALFDGDPSLDPIAMAEWWACPACRTALLGDGRTPSVKRASPPRVD